MATSQNRFKSADKREELISIEIDGIFLDISEILSRLGQRHTFRLRISRPKDLSQSSIDKWANELTWVLYLALDYSDSLTVADISDIGLIINQATTLFNRVRVWPRTVSIESIDSGPDYLQ